MTGTRELAEASWAWVLDQVRWDEHGPWIPLSTADTEPTWDRDGFHSGIGGLAHALAEIRLTRELTAAERDLSDATAERVRSNVERDQDVTFFDGLVSTLGVLIALEQPGADRVIARLEDLAHADGWTSTTTPKNLPADVRLLDVTLGAAGVLLGATWARRNQVPSADRLVERAASIVLAEREVGATGSNWRFVPQHQAPDYPQMPNFSHGLAGITAALAVAGWVEEARDGAEHLISLGRREGDGFVLPRRIPVAPDQDEVTHNWCHGGAGTSLAFAAYEFAGITEIAGDSPATWRRRSLQGIRDAGVPGRRYPGFWDNDGRCCGTAGVADVFLDLWQSEGDQADLDYVELLTDTLVARAEGQPFWRFLEHKADDPLLPPGVGWMQGATGIATYLFRVSRVLAEGRGAARASRMDNWWVS
ncbi:MAG: lanthionine synthetase LanC family protein [Marmoricola sp.]